MKTWPERYVLACSAFNRAEWYLRRNPRDKAARRERSRALRRIRQIMRGWS